MSTPTVLAENHRRNGAELVEDDGWLLPKNFGDAAAEYAAVRSAAGLFDLCHYAAVELTGPDRASFLQGMVSNDVKKLAPGDGLYAAVLDVNGKILADLRVLCTEDSFILLLLASLKPRIIDHLNRYLVADEVEIKDHAGRYGMISIQGQHALLLLNAVAPHQDPPVRMFSHCASAIAGRQTRAVRTTHTGEEGFDIVAEIRDVTAIAAELERAGAALSARWVGLEAQEVLRVEAGLPRYGIDMGEDNILLETNLDAAVSFNKGCYLGQEVIERVHSRGHVNRKLAGIVLDGNAAARRGDSVLSDGKEIGKITSSVYSPKLNHPIALAYLQRDFLPPATSVAVKIKDGEINGTVATLPFVFSTSP
ncbi:MAG TPA: aminomethyltransferase family protein [Verrucomicrobiae bacterium]|jgi:glycine cleavage system T protein|nr:aminomethyltransferase family protein [Verrucomicrobiae bacterium]